MQGKRICGVVFQRPTLPRLLMLFVLLALQTLLLEAPLLVKLLPLLPLRLDAPPLLGLGPAKHGRPVQCRLRFLRSSLRARSLARALLL